MPAKLILIRHGETDWNRDGRYQGWCDTPLNAKGRGQARLVALRLKHEKIDKVYSSDRRRALESAGIIFGKTPINGLPELREMGFGVFEGLTYDEARTKYPSVYENWLKDPFNTTIPGGEEPAVFRNRVTGMFENIIGMDGPDVFALVVHGGPISIILSSICESKSSWDMIPKTASISIVEIKGGKRIIAVLNDTSHLENG